MIIRVIPADGRRSLQLGVVANAWSGLHNYLNMLQQLKLTVGDDLDQGWLEINCPSCRSSLDPYWFAERVERQAALSRVSQMLTMPCCSSNLSIKTLFAQEKQRLSGFVLSFQSLGREMDTKVVKKLEEVLSCQLSVYYDAAP